MRSFKIRLSTLDDADLLADRAVEPVIRNNPELVRLILDHSIKRGPAYTATYGGEIVAAAGVRISRPGIGIAWAIFCDTLPVKLNPPTAEAMEYLSEAIWSIEQGLAIIAAEFGLRRVRTHSRKGFTASQKLLKAIGFERYRKETENLYFYGKSWAQQQ